jgi:hypothetical protein
MKMKARRTYSSRTGVAYSVRPPPYLHATLHDPTGAT